MNSKVKKPKGLPKFDSMSKIKAILVDDEESSRDVLENLLLLFCEDVDVVDKCKSVLEAVESIKNNQPDVVFLDIEMPQYAGYEIVNFIEDVNFDIIFVTAYDQYAIRAFEVAAIDYLLKPVDIDRLKSAVERVRLKRNKEHQLERLSLLKDSIENKEIKSLLIYDKSQQHVLPFDSIIAIEAQESYCVIHTKEKTYVVSKNLRHFEKTLEGIDRFFRVHRSWIINKDHLLNYSKTDLTIHLSNDLTTKLSKYRKVEFEQFAVH